MTDKREFLFLFMLVVFFPLHLFALQNLSIIFETGSHEQGVLQDSLLYIATERGIDIYTTADPSVPLLLRSLDTPGICTCLSIDNGILAASDSTAVHLFSLADPINPLPFGTYRSAYTFRHIGIRDSTIAVSTIPNGITLLTCTGGSLDSTFRISFNEEVTALVLKDTLLIIGLASAGLTIYGISDPSQPTLLLSSFPLEVHDLAAQDTLLYCASGTHGVNILSISDPASPDSIGCYTPGDYLLAVTAADSFLCCSGLTESLYVARIVDPAYPLHHCTFPTEHLPRAAATNGTILYAAEGSTGELFSLPLQGTLAQLNPFQPVTCAALAESIALAAVQDSGLAILDISSPASPVLLSWYATSDTIKQMLARDSIIFLARSSADLSILNISEPASPVHIADYHTPGTLLDIAKRGRVLLLADGGSGLQTVSIDDLATPTLLDSLMLPGYSQDIALADSLAIVSLGPKGYAVVSIADPHNLFVVDTVSIAGYALSCAAHENMFFIGTRDNALLIYDLATWRTPQLIATHPAPGPVHDLFFANNLLFAACGDGGLQIIDVSDAAAPVCYDSIDTPGVSSTMHQLLSLTGTADRFGFRIDSFAFTDTTPPHPVTNLSLLPEDSVIAIRWNNPYDSDYRGTRVLFRNDTFPLTPDDGTVLLDHSSEPLAPDSCFHSDLPGDSTRFYYAVYAYDLAHNFSAPARASAISATDTIPPSEVSLVAFSFWGNLLEVSFMTPGDPDFLGVRAMFDTTHTPQHIHDGELFFDRSLASNTTYAETLSVAHGHTYHFTFFSKDSVPNFSPGHSISFQTIDTIPPGDVTLQLVQFHSTQCIRIQFRTPSESDLSGVRACYDLSSPPPDPYTGTLFFDEDFTPDSSLMRELGGVVLDTTYYFTFFSRDTALNFSSGISCTSLTTLDTLPPDTILQFTVTPRFPDTVDLRWTNPPDTGLYYVRFKYDTDTFPEAPDSGDNIKNETVAPGQPDSIRWSPSEPGVNLFVSAFSYDRWGNFSKGVHAWCRTPTLTTLNTYDPVDGGMVSWLDTVSLTFTAPIQQSSVPNGIELTGTHSYPFTVERTTGNTYLLMPQAFASLDTITISLHNGLLDSIGNPFDGNGNGMPDSVDDYSWNFYTRPICDYTANDTINAEDFAILRNALEIQDITKEVGPCSGAVPHYLLLPDSIVDFEDFAIFIMMWNWSLDTRGIPKISAGDIDSLIFFQQKDTLILMSTNRKAGLTGGEIIIHNIGEPYRVSAAEGMGNDDLFLTKRMESGMAVCFGLMDEMHSSHIAYLSAPQPEAFIEYSYRLIYDGGIKEGMGRRCVDNLLPHQTLLQKIHPNPGKHITITFGIPRDLHVSLNLYDAAGRRVSQLLNKRLQAGYHSITLDAHMNESVPASGIYFVRLRTDDTSLIQKIVILK